MARLLIAHLLEFLIHNFISQRRETYGKKNGAQSVEVIPGRNIVLSAGVGKTNIEELKWLTETVLTEAKSWKTSGWAYIADCSQMDPVSPDEGGELVNMTKKFVEAGCKAFAFAEGKSIMLKVQAKKNTERSQTGITEGHFATVEEALDWLKDEIHI
uniref:hypothetical protein n=1 Tax=Acetatifactor sp. TaxID=1872090 RepID=UPI00405744DA